jgi:hypothetical protein
MKIKKLFGAVIIGSMISGAVLAGGTYVDTVTTSVTNIPVSINMTNMVQASGANIAWKPGIVMLRCYDAPTGDVLKVEHVRTGVTLGSNTISVTNAILQFTTTTAQTSVVWSPTSDYVIGTSTEYLKISSSSTNAVLSVNREIAR